MKVKKCGLFVYKEKPFLGATPDGVIDDGNIIEVKCPFAGRKQRIELQSIKYFKFFEVSDDKVKLKKRSHYFDQIQGQLLISGRESCYFVVYTLKSLFVEKIDIDREYCGACLLPKLETFYTKYYRPFIASRL